MVKPLNFILKQRNFKRILSLLIFAGLFFTAPTRTFAASSITISVPDTKGTWFAGTSHPMTISWSGNPSEITIFAIHQNNVEFFGEVGIIKNMPEQPTLSAAWKIARNQTPGPYSIKVSANYDGIWISETSKEVVNVAQPTLTVNSPTDKQVLNSGSVFPMSWSYTGPPSPFSVSIKSPGAPAFETIATGIEATSYDWNVPSDLPGGTYDLLIEAPASETSLQRSISINNPELRIVMPDTDVTWYSGNIIPASVNPVTVAFTGTLSELKVSALHQKDASVVKNFDTQTNLNLSNTNAVTNWTIDPKEMPGPYKIRISAILDGKTITATSHTVINVEPTTVTIDTPFENSLLDVGQIYPVVWSHKGPANAFDIKVYNAENSVAYSTSTWATGTSANWPVDNALSEGNYTLEVCGVLSEKNSVCSSRRPLMIQPPGKITLDAPAPDATLYKGGTYPISWTATKGLTNFWIDSYNAADLKTPAKVAADLTVSNYSWNISSMAAGAYKLIVCAMKNPSLKICSDMQPITIQESSLTFLSPDGNSISFLADTIKWTVVGMTSPVNFSVRRVSTGVDYSIAKNVDPTAGSLNWEPSKIIPDYASNETLQIKAEAGGMVWTSPAFTIEIPPAPELSFYGTLTSSPSSPTSTVPFTLSVRIKNDGIDPFVEGLTTLKINIDGLEPDSCSMELNGKTFTDCSHLPIPDIEPGKIIPLPPITVVYDSRDSKRVTTSLQAVIDHFGTTVAEKENAAFYIKGSPQAE